MNNTYLADLISKDIIDAILASEINVNVIPDEVEREIYHRILTIITNISWLDWIKRFFY